MALPHRGDLCCSPVGRWHRGALAAIIVAGLGLTAWAGWLSAQLLTPAARATGFPFLPIDLLGEGWYAALLAFAISVDGIASDASRVDRPALPREDSPFSSVPLAGTAVTPYPGPARL